MLKETKQIIRDIASINDRAILFHSANGKDSIALLDLMASEFKEIVCCFMYQVKGLEHIEKYIKYAETKYPNCKFIQTPHYSVYSYIKSGYLGIKKDAKQKQYTLKDIDDYVRQKTGINLSFYGFKQSDSMNRRLMLRTYKENAICEKTNKIYPLSQWKNADVLNYIRLNNLIEPTKYGDGQSQGCDVTGVNFLMWCKKNYPNDLAKIIEVFPETEILIYQYEQSSEA
jgi:3'-phosphoadenosine 5'-phosphosulfate sulfotransferase (PAPS reductase)/FAD synthetase